MTEGLLLNWTKKIGDTIAVGDVIAEIETDKATVEVPSEVAGTIIALNGNPGDTLKVGSVIGQVGAAGEAAPAAAPAQAAPAAQAQPAQQQAPAQQAPAAQATPAQLAPAAQAAPAPAPAPAAENGNGNGSLPDGVKASPVARNIASERGIDLKLVTGSGPGGRIVKTDVENFTPSAAPAAAPATQGAPAAAEAQAIPAASYGKLPSGPDVEIVDVTKLRSRIAARLVQSKQQIPHFYVTTDIDVEALLALRKQLNDSVTDDTQKVTVNDLIVKATALALKQFPNLNSHFYGDKIVRHKRINIGIAVSLDGGGLMNVVAKDADKVSLGTMAAQNKAMFARAREGKVKPEDVADSTFTVSNLGSYDVDSFYAIINPPEAAILAISSAKKVPVVKADGTLGVGTRMKVAISVDHRVSDGAEGADYLKAFKAILENPMRLLL
jgi:pyruvate dehydrogenase E2 component (dihydrolipoamide acetyltransferase)